MSVTFLVHLEPSPETGAVWWAETTAIPGLSVAADTLAELEALAREAVALHRPEAHNDVRFVLAPSPPPTAGEAATLILDDRLGGSQAPGRPAPLPAIVTLPVGR